MESITTRMKAKYIYIYSEMFLKLVIYHMRVYSTSKSRLKQVEQNAEVFFSDQNNPLLFLLFSVLCISCGSCMGFYEQFFT